MGTFRGRDEEDPGLLKMRQRGAFKSENRARSYMKKLAGKTELRKLETGFGVFQEARHEFIGAKFRFDMRPDGPSKPVRIFRPKLYGTGELVDIIDGQACGFFIFEMGSAVITEDMKRAATSEIIRRQSDQPQVEPVEEGS